jgi:hypothetical protein
MSESQSPSRASWFDKISSEADRISKIAAVARDIGLLVGVPILIMVGSHLYGLQINALEAQNKATEAQVKATEAQNNFLKDTQYDKTLALIKSQRELYLIERRALEAENTRLVIRTDYLTRLQQKDEEEERQRWQPREDELRNLTLEFGEVAKRLENALQQCKTMPSACQSTDLDAFKAVLRSCRRTKPMQDCRVSLPCCSALSIHTAICTAAQFRAN